MKTAQELKAGNVVNINGQPWVVLRAEYSKSGRNTALVKTKFKNLLVGSISEIVYKADDKFEPVYLENKEATFSYFSDPSYVFMGVEDFEQYEIDKENIGDLINFIEDGMTDVCEVVLYDGKPISIQLPNTIVREITYTEPAVRGDTSGKVMKMARLTNGYELQVSAFCEIGDKIEIDTRTNEFKGRAKG